MAKKLAPPELPGWPRLMNGDLAGAHLGVSAATVATPPLTVVRIGSRRLYDKLELDRWVDSQAGGEAEDQARSLLDRIAQCGVTGDDREQARQSREARKEAWQADKEAEAQRPKILGRNKRKPPPPVTGSAMNQRAPHLVRGAGNAMLTLDQW